MRGRIRQYTCNIRGGIVATIVVAILVLMLANPGSGLSPEEDTITVTVDSDSVYIAATFDRTDYGGQCDTLLGEWTYQFSTSADTIEACSTYAVLSYPAAKSTPACHLHINRDGCIYLDVLLLGASGTGEKVIEFALPIDEIIADSSFIFTNDSDYDDVLLDSYFQWPVSNGEFVFERGQAYEAELFEVPSKCAGHMSRHPERSVCSDGFDISCCDYHVGDANCSGDDLPTIGDISYLIDHLFINPDTLYCCLPEADVNQSGGSSPSASDITIADPNLLTYILFDQNDPSLLEDCIY